MLHHLLFTSMVLFSLLLLVMAFFVFAKTVAAHSAGRNEQLSKHPSEQASEHPSEHPSKHPSKQLSKHPSEHPSKQLSKHPSEHPSKQYDVKKSLMVTVEYGEKEAIFENLFINQNVASNEVLPNILRFLYLDLTTNQAHNMFYQNAQIYHENALNFHLLQYFTIVEDIYEYLTSLVVKFFPDMPTHLRMLMFYPGFMFKNKLFTKSLKTTKNSIPLNTRDFVQQSAKYPMEHLDIDDNDTDVNQAQQRILNSFRNIYKGWPQNLMILSSDIANKTIEELLVNNNFIGHTLLEDIAEPQYKSTSHFITFEIISYCNCMILQERRLQINQLIADPQSSVRQNDDNDTSLYILENPIIDVLRIIAVVDNVFTQEICRRNAKTFHALNEYFETRSFDFRLVQMALLNLNCPCYVLQNFSFATHFVESILLYVTNNEQLAVALNTEEFEHISEISAQFYVFKCLTFYKNPQFKINENLDSEERMKRKLLILHNIQTALLAWNDSVSHTEFNKFLNKLVNQMIADNFFVHVSEQMLQDIDDVEVIVEQTQ